MGETGTVAVITPVVTNESPIKYQRPVVWGSQALLTYYTFGEAMLYRKRDAIFAMDNQLAGKSGFFL